MPLTPLRSYQELQAAIAALPAPTGTSIRTYRGQTKDYRAIPSSYGRVQLSRGSAVAAETFIQHLFVKSALLTVLGDLLALPKLNRVDFRVGAAEFFLAEAMVQHYGYQTRYVDVTTSLEVAVWFARHRFEGAPEHTVPGSAPPQCAFPAWYVAAQGTSVIYVLDVEPWDGAGHVQSGQYIDLVAIAPEGVNRPKRQQGGVLYVPASAEAVEDAYRYVVASFEIDFDWQGTGRDWSSAYLFPGPDEDPVYERLLGAPFFQGLRRSADGSDEEVQRRAFSIPEYLGGPDDGIGRAGYRARDTWLRPTLFHPWLRRRLDELVVNPSWHAALRAAFEGAAPILMTMPHMLVSLRRGGPAAPPSEPPPVPEALRNFFLEASPDSFALGYDEARMPRGVWCHWIAPNQFLLQSFGTQAGKPFSTDPCLFEWQAERGLIQTAGADVSQTSYVPRLLEIIRMLVAGELSLLPPGRLGHGYLELTTNAKFWQALPRWTDLI